MKEFTATKIRDISNKEYNFILDIFQNLFEMPDRKPKLGKYKYITLQDVLDLITFYTLVTGQKFKKAQSFGQNLDTQVRELIPAYIHNNLIEVENL